MRQLEGTGSPALDDMSCLMHSLVCVSLLQFWLSHVALADTKWVQSGVIWRGAEGRGPEKKARVLGLNRALQPFTTGSSL